MITAEQEKVVRRAAEGGMFEDLCKLWFSTADEPTLRFCADDTFALRELFARVENLLGAYAEEKDVTMLVRIAFYEDDRGGDAGSDFKSEAFAVARLRGAPWSLGS